MFKLAIVLFMVMGFAFSADAQQVPVAARDELTSKGRLRVGINFGNALLATKSESGAASGIAVDLARELAKRVGAPLDIIGYDTAGRMADGAKAGAWDVAFLGADPDRAGEIAFTAPYLEIDTTYLVPPGSLLRTVEDVDRQGVRIAISDKSAYDLFLTRNLKHAELVRVPGVNPSVDLFFAQKLDALAGLKPLLIEVADAHPGMRLLDGRFTVVQQAVGAPKGGEAAAKYLAAFVADIKTSGFVAQAVEKNHLRGVSVPK